VVLLALSSAVAFAGDYPIMKDGLWSTTVTMASNKVPPQSGTMCNSTAVFQAMMDARKGPNRPCQSSGVEHSGSTYTDHMTCNFGGRVTQTTTIATFTGDTAVHTEIHQADGTVSMSSDSKYLGSCPAGMVPGDYVDSKGTKFNILHPETAVIPGKKP
jgi:hypothetical protein